MRCCHEQEHIRGCFSHSMHGFPISLHKSRWQHEARIDFGSDHMATNYCQLEQDEFTYGERFSSNDNSHTYFGLLKCSANTDTGI